MADTDTKPPVAAADKGKLNEETNQPDETNAEKFVRLAELRVGNALESIRKITLLANKSQYGYTEEQIDAIDAALSGAIQSSMTALRTGRPSTSTFKL